MTRWHESEFQPQSKKLWIRLKGEWRLGDLPAIKEELKQNPLNQKGQIPAGTSCVVDGSQLQAIDTAAAHSLLSWLLWEFPEEFHSKVHWSGLRPEHERLIELVLKAITSDGGKKDSRSPHLGLIAGVGKSALDIGSFLKEMVVFFGATLLEFGRTLANPSRLRVRELFVQLEMVCLNAIPIVALVTFLIGIVIAYLFGIQIQKYGANIFIVDGCCIAMCRELSPILAAIILAGRSGSAFTAQLGAMKINEEVDALSVLGLSPIRVLVLPRVLALMIALPLLVFVGDIVGILGSMVIADLKLDITGITFLNRLQNVLTVKSFFVGLLKAPVFAMFIGIIGCQMGLSVEDNARSLGLGTTATVVRSIVAVILLNAGFAVLFSELKI